MSPRLYCRLAFLLLCVAPTLAMAGTVVSRRLPDWFAGSKCAWEADLSQRLGFRVSLAKVTRPHAGTTLLEGVELADRETGKLVARARLVEAAQTDQGLVLVLSQPELHVEEFAALAGTLHDALMRVARTERTAAGNATDRRNAAIHFLAEELLVTSATHSRTFAGIDGLFESLPAGPQATIRFRLPERTGEEPAQFRVTRNRDST